MFASRAQVKKKLALICRHMCPPTTCFGVLVPTPVTTPSPSAPLLSLPQQNPLPVTYSIPHVCQRPALITSHVLPPPTANGDGFGMPFDCALEFPSFPSSPSPQQNA